MTELVLVRGHSGSGKTTFAKSLQGFVPVAGDDYFTVGDKYEFNPALLGAAHDYCLKETARNLRLGCDVVVHNTFTRLWEMDKYTQLAKDYGVKLTVYRCSNFYQNVHGVPDKVVQRQINRMQDYEGEIHV